MGAGGGGVRVWVVEWGLGGAGPHYQLNPHGDVC